MVELALSGKISDIIKIILLFTNFGKKANSVKKLRNN